MGLFSFFGKGKIIDLIHRGAMIVDVRPAYAFDQHGRIPDSVNIPLDRIPISIGRLKDVQRPIIICCEYGNDCEKASRLLKESGVKEVHNGGSWRSIMRKL